MQTPTIDLETLLGDLNALAGFAEPSAPGRTRRAFSPSYREARLWLAEVMQDAGMDVVLDASANLVGRWPGRANYAPIVLGSHTDTVPDAGQYDGMLGVLAGIAVVRALRDAGVALRHPIEVIDFLGEEPTPFGSCVGSAAFAGGLGAEALDRRDANGRTLAEALRFLGGRPEALEAEARPSGSIAAYLELHIEQGRVLEERGAALGVVEGIVGIRRARLRLEGRPDHAGTTPMSMRQDALAAAAEVVLALERLARGAGNAVGTVGTLEVAPNHSNVVPGAVGMSIEIRSLAWPTVERLWDALLADAERACAERSVALQVGSVEDTAPMRSPAWLVELLGQEVRAVAPGAPTLPSGAGHDGSWVGRIAPAGMIFVRCRDGRSHCPEEYATPEDIALGAEALLRAVLALDARIET